MIDFNRSLQYVLQFEGGFVNDPTDRGEQNSDIRYGC